MTRTTAQLRQADSQLRQHPVLEAAGAADRDREVEEEVVHPYSKHRQ